VIHVAAATALAISVRNSAACLRARRRNETTLAPKPKQDGVICFQMGQLVPYPIKQGK
jgi:hypothetical protein